jgi:tRNA(Ser,Leu) C12 N-acetylase TAN1
MPQTDSKKSVDIMHRGAQFAVVKDRKIIRQQTTRRTEPVMLKKEEVTIMPAKTTAAPVATPKKAVEEMEQPQYTIAQKAARQATRQANAAQNTVQKRTAAEIKNHAIERAIREASNPQASQKTRREKRKISFGFKRLALALVCTAAAVFAIVYFVNLNTPDISLRVAALQNGINASYPKYTPRGFNLTDITSENGKITLNFKDSTAENTYALIEEKSSWDSNALLSNYVKPNYEDDHTVIKEQGLTLYVSNNEASWVNGGIFYRLKITNGSLTKKQIKTIATSL